MRNIFKLVAVPLTLIFQGCGTMYAYGPAHPTKEGFEIRKGYFPASKSDLLAINDVFTEGSISSKIFMTPILIVDIPISLCLDTIFLPTKMVEKRNEKNSGREGAEAQRGVQ